MADIFILQGECTAQTRVIPAILYVPAFALGRKLYNFDIVNGILQHNWSASRHLFCYGFAWIWGSANIAGCTACEPK
jgi:hypothetical protein